LSLPIASGSPNSLRIRSKARRTGAVEGERTAMHAIKYRLQASETVSG
jgi:hypothetical protein